MGPSKEVKRVNRRIIVIGSGGAGLVAAIAARKPGTEVVVLSKTPLGTGSCTAYAAGIFTLGCGQVAPEMHASKTLEIGCHVNDLNLVQIFSENARKSMEELQSWGVSLRLMDSGHASTRASAPNPFMAGYGMVEELYGIAMDLGIRFVENTVATELKIEDGKVRGVECVNWKTGKVCGFGASAVILATGGAGQIYERTDNPTRITGDGYSLALRAGVPLRDMEFVQFYPLGWDEPGFTNWMIDLAMIDRVPLLDEKGREFLLEAIQSWGLKDGMEANYYARDKGSIFLARHLKRGGKAMLHLEQIPEKEWQDEPLVEMLTFYPEDKKPWEYGPVGVRPLEHYMTGGIVIDPSCATGIKGLYACGEVTGGVDGASRIGGNALTNIVTFGLIAGKTASAEITERSADFDPLHTKEMVKNWTEGNESTSTVRKTIRETVQEGLSPVRTAASINKTIARLMELYPAHSRLEVTNHLELLSALEIRGLLDSAMSVAKAALAREESRGVHFREDYPVQRDEWKRVIQVSLENEIIRAETENG